MARTLPMSRFLGRLLRRAHAGEHKLLWNDLRLAAPGPALRLSSPAFEAGGRLPLRYAGVGVGENLSPPLRWSEVPAQARELVLVLEDPDAPLLSPFLHLMLFGIAPDCTGLKEGALSTIASTGRFGINTFRRRSYAGPRALPGHGPHRYVFQLFALSRALNLDVCTRRQVLEGAAGSVLGRGRLDVTFERSTETTR
jgi:Raf kinase inhibitor-like YbhB/YbcL family protein